MAGVLVQDATGHGVFRDWWRPRGLDLFADPLHGVQQLRRRDMADVYGSSGLHGHGLDGNECDRAGELQWGVHDCGSAAAGGECLHLRHDGM